MKIAEDVSLSFVGRHAELDRIIELLSTPLCRLLTLVGPGGIGKTRLAIEAARSFASVGVIQRVFPTDATQPPSSRNIFAPLSEFGEGLGVRFPDGVHFVPLQPIISPDFVLTAIASEVGCHCQPGSDPRQQLIDHFRDKSLLLVLDNLEHLLDAADLFSAILKSSPDARILATSRERLNLAEEWALELGGLDYPTSESETDIERYGAVELFLQHARRVSVNFTLDATQKPALVRICRLVNGMPLALELAAAWVRALSCETIAAEIQKGLDILETPARNVEPRHRNMRAALDWSWNLLTPAEQDVLQKLSVFRGGFTLDAAAYVAGASLRPLTALVDKSLVRTAASGRYDLHELLRQYAEEKLNTAPDERQKAHDLHCADYLGILERCQLKTRQQINALNVIQADFDNIRAAWLWASKNLDGALENLYLFCEARSRFQDGLQLFAYALQNSAADDALWGRLAARHARLHVLGSASGELWAENDRSLSIAQTHRNLSEIAFCLWTRGEIGYVEHDYDQAIGCFEQALDHYACLNDDFYTARTLQRLAAMHGGTGKHEGYVRYAQQGLELARRMGDNIGMSNCLYNLAWAAASIGNLAQSEAYGRQALALRVEAGDRANTAMSMTAMGLYAMLRGDVTFARTYTESALRLASEINHDEGKGYALAALGTIANMEGDYERGQQLCAQGRALSLDNLRMAWAEWGLAIAACGLDDFHAARSHLRSLLDYTLPVHYPLYNHLAISVMALILAREGAAQHAVELFALALHDYPASWLEHWQQFHNLRTRLQIQLTPDGYTAAWERGKHLDTTAVMARLDQMFQPSREGVTFASAQTQIEPLTEREIEILRLIGEGYTNRRIAQTLILAEGTIKWYSRQIYGKLGVQNRAQAVRHAQLLKILPG